MTGTLVNAAAIVAGSLLGTLVHARLSRAIVEILFQGMGLVTIAIAIPMTLHPSNVALVVVSVAGGAALGQWIDLDKRTRRLTDRLRRVGAPPGDAGSRFTEGIVTSSMLFCVGSMAILGAIEEGTGHPPKLLFAKSVMDGITSIAFASSFGAAILFSALPVLLYQGLLTLFAASIARFMSEAMLSDLTATGGVLLLGLGLTILKIKEIPVINMLPALLLAPLLHLVWGS
jgi:uncharacterized membrane protein YqgA involved in biofilm formation